MLLFLFFAVQFAFLNAQSYGSMSSNGFGYGSIHIMNDGCMYINGKVYDNGIQRQATSEEIDMVSDNMRDWDQWGQDFENGMNDHMSKLFPPGFPFNSPILPPPLFVPPRAPRLRCICSRC